jgi:hypothetical protein
MASRLYKVTGLSYVDIPDPPPTYDNPSQPSSGQPQSTSPLTPNPSSGSPWGTGTVNWKPPSRPTQIPRPDSNTPVNSWIEWEWVFIPPNELTGKPGEYVLLAKVPDGYSGVSIPLPHGYFG